MVLHNPNNWHWVDKNCIDWTRRYFGEKLTQISAEDGDLKASVSKVKSVEGDVEVCQRKGKVISLFDVRVALQYEGSVKDEQVSGEISVPEVAYDSEADDYQFTITISNETSAKFPIKAFIRQKIVPQLRTAFQQFGKDLIATHGSDIQHPDQTLSGKKMEDYSATSATSASPKVVGTAAYNTTTLHLKPTFNCTVDQLYETFLDPARVQAWTRSAPKIQAVEGSDYSLFAGNISGTIKKLVPNKSIDMSWRLKDWKEGHFADLKLNFEEGAGETKLNVDWSGIPVGQEEVCQKNFEGYYVRSIKVTFGFGIVL